MNEYFHACVQCTTKQIHIICNLDKNQKNRWRSMPHDDDNAITKHRNKYWKYICFEINKFAVPCQFAISYRKMQQER